MKTNDNQYVIKMRISESLETLEYAIYLNMKETEKQNK